MNLIQDQIQQARGLDRGQKFQAAFDAYMKLADKAGPHTEDPGFWLPLAEVARRADHTEPAVEAYGRVIELFMEAGQPHNALAISRRVLRIKADDPAALRAIATLTSEQPVPASDDAATDEMPATDDDFPALTDQPAAPDPGLETTAIADPSDYAPLYDRLEGLETTAPDDAPSDLEPESDEEAAQDDLPLLPQTAAFGSPRPDIEPDPPPSEAPDTHADDYIDLASLIRDEDDEDATSVHPETADRFTGGGDQDFSDILEMLPQQTSQTIHPKDSSSPYDLGLAFKEMGLLDDAIGQLRKALTGGDNPLATLEVMGECLIEQDQHALAVRVLHRATQLDGATEADLVGVHYTLGRCEDVLGNTAEARAHYERVISADPGFRDAAARLNAIPAPSDNDS